MYFSREVQHPLTSLKERAKGRVSFHTHGRGHEQEEGTGIQVNVRASCSSNIIKQDVESVQSDEAEARSHCNRFELFPLLVFV
jgi:hypothetical protein